MRLEIDDEALAEAEQARDLYASRSVKVGEDFSLQLDLAIQNILTNPTLWAPWSGQIRQYVFKQFPYSVFYRVTGDVIRVLSVTHQRRRSGHWRRRSR